MRDPIGSYERLQEALKKYVTTAFRTDSSDFEQERRALLDTPGVLFQEAYVEPLPEYESRVTLDQLTDTDLPGTTTEAREVFARVAGAGLFRGGFPLYVHQQAMLRHSLSGQHCVVVTGTGSGKTESFLLPVLATIIREAVGARRWPKVSGQAQKWSPATPPKWDESRRSARAEGRDAAVRALVLYPMNALVEDQVSRLRVALDSDPVHEALDSCLGGNRIRFGRFNGSTPVSGHPFKADGKPNDSARQRLKSAIVEALRVSAEVRANAANARAVLAEARASGDSAKVRAAEEALEKAEELCAFVPRMAPDASEMFHRWEMQLEPPDILVTNVSMLSMMLMRHRHAGIIGDRADSDMLETTRQWLEKDAGNVFQLVIDELHLYRGAAGTEVAYLIRLLLDRLGLHPTHPQLRILASSASLDGGSDESFSFLGGFFGLTLKEARATFHVESGEAKLGAHADGAELRKELAESCLDAGRSVASGRGAEDVDTTALTKLVIADATLAGRLLAAFGQDRLRATAVGTLANRWFPSLSDADQCLAVRGLFLALSEPSLKSHPLPRFRFHWMARNVDGLWALPQVSSDDPRRRVGRLLPEGSLTGGQMRVLEVLYCECCGTQLLCGNKVPLSDADLLGAVANTSGIPGMDSAGGAPVAFELTLSSPQLSGLPEQYAEVRTDAQKHRDLGVVWLITEEEAAAYKSREPITWLQRSEEAKDQGLPVVRTEAAWRLARLDPTGGIVRVGTGSNQVELSGTVPCLWFECAEEAAPKPSKKAPKSAEVAPTEMVAMPAMPQRCPSCLIDYSDRRGGRLAPIRSFVTGLSRMSHLLAKHLLAGLPSGDARRVVAFSDSREGAATLASGVELEQWQHLLRVFLLRQLFERASGGLTGAKREVVAALSSGDVAAAKQRLLAAKETLPEDSYKDLQALYSIARSYFDDPELAPDGAMQQLEEILKVKPGFVRLDDLLGTPSSTPGAPLTPIWKEFAELGVSPAGARLDERTLVPGRLDWTSVFEKENGHLRARLRIRMSDSERQHVKDLSDRLRRATWRAISGRLLYDLEAQGIGHLALAPGLSLVPPAGMDEPTFRSACESVIRILTEEKRTDPSTRGDEESGWKPTEPTGSNLERAAAKRRVSRYLKAVADKLGVDATSLRDAVRDALLADGHRAGDNGWGVVSLGRLWVRVTERDAHAWRCRSCNQLHWHSSAGTCSRCCAPLTSEPNGELTAGEVAARHYNSREALDQSSAFRLHAEELTGQTENQAQRQRHFRDIFFKDEEVSDIGSRDALRNVDAIDLLSVTTTMEVGVDIGSLQAVLQANMPPERFNYQQRAGRAGRKGQRFSAVLTYCRGQTHDRIHFDHPEEMTGGEPPQPAIALGNDQRILADRLVAKEVLRQAFRGIGLTWASSGSPPDTHGEMGTVAEWTPERSQAIRKWLEANGDKVRHVATVIARGASQDVDALVAEARRLPDRIDLVINNGEFVDDTVAQRLAAAGVLPMYGMPTNVRSLYFDLSKPTDDVTSDEARSLERDFDQAVSEFVPGAERTWDKRLLRPIGLVGRVRRPQQGGWRTEGSPAGAAFVQLHCAECRQLLEAPAHPETLEPLGDVPWWQREWVSAPPRGVPCPSCGLPAARPYVAVAPRSFITDLDLSHPAGGGDSRGKSIPAAHISSPASGIGEPFTSVGSCSITLRRQGRVFRTNRNGGDLFALTDWSRLPAPNGPTVHGTIWVQAHDVSSARRKVAFVSPKTTDILAIRAQDAEGLRFFDERSELSAKRAAWYSAATILQRAIALELDVDSLDIEIASVHRFSDPEAGSGAELYLADAHPNGAGLVAWARDQWLDLLRGCITGTGPASELGQRLQDERERQGSQPWRSPDLLLKGFRNRSLHGLIDHDLGAELLAVLLDPSFQPGIHSSVAGADGLPVKLGDWSSLARSLAARYAGAFPGIAKVVSGEGSWHGWWELDRPGTMALVVHPLWAHFPGARNGLASAFAWAMSRGAKVVRLVDTFNLQRRMSWVRSRRDAFSVVDLSLPGGIGPEGGGGAQSAGLSGGVAPQPGAFSSIVVPTADPNGLAVGTRFAHGIHAYERVSETPLLAVANGGWLVRLGSGEITHVIVRKEPGMKGPQRRRSGGAPLSEADTASAIVIARQVSAASVSPS